MAFYDSSENVIPNFSYWIKSWNILHAFYCLMCSQIAYWPIKMLRFRPCSPARWIGLARPAFSAYLTIYVVSLVKTVSVIGSMRVYIFLYSPPFTQTGLQFWDLCPFIQCCGSGSWSGSVRIWNFWLDPIWIRNKHFKSGFESGLESGSETGSETSL